MTGGSGRRRLRLRRKRKDETFGSKLSDVGSPRPPVRSQRSFDPVSLGDAAEAVEVVGRMGCCVVEAIGSAAVLLALLTVPTYLLLTRVT